jgi:hypothetical protein
LRERGASGHLVYGLCSHEAVSFTMSKSFFKETKVDACLQRRHWQGKLVSSSVLGTQALGCYALLLQANRCQLTVLFIQPPIYRGSQAESNWQVRQPHHGASSRKNNGHLLQYASPSGDVLGFGDLRNGPEAPATTMYTA